MLDFRHGKRGGHHASLSLVLLACREQDTRGKIHRQGACLATPIEQTPGSARTFDDDEPGPSHLLHSPTGRGRLGVVVRVFEHVRERARVGSEQAGAREQPAVAPGGAVRGTCGAVAIAWGLVGASWARARM